MQSGVIKNTIISVLLVTTLSCSYNYYKASQELERINAILEYNPLLKSCFIHPRKIAFIQKGGEYLPDYKNPRTLNDKIAHLLENYFLKSPITRVIGTKYFAKKYVADIVGEEHVVQLLGVWDNPEDIDWNRLPNKFVLKSVRGNFGREVIAVTDKRKLNIPDTIDQLKKFCNVSGMKNIHEKRIIAEELIENENGTPVRDYKFFCSYGKPFVAYCLEGKKSGTKNNSSNDTDIDSKTFSFYTLPDWKALPVKAGKHEQNNLPKPKNFEKMLEICRKLSAPFPLIRIDFYESGNRVLVGEITEDASGGKNIMKPVIWDFKLGENIPVASKEKIAEMLERDKEISKRYLGL